MLRCWRSCAPGPAGLDGLRAGCAGERADFVHTRELPPWLTPDAGQLACAGVDLSTGFDLSSVFDGATG